ncbi:hypothetical protein [Paenibacillus sp. NFR01]|uniref:hypothetical protein n=1 Tax=Paenibacillus sp. NFR01 TaxID=1566279 RepID=UPI0008AD04ED|nr:hypothetical protein [Paenibacillus sp. NFR01]SET07803.1 hypothetical protein SAMN03159358_0675 [Paenibacillus sp. NFR01]
MTTFIRSKWLYGLIIIAILLLMIPKYSYNDPDTFWHIEVGRYMLEHGQILHYAIHTFYGDKLPYVPHEFGFQLIVAPLYAAFGWPGIYLLTAVCLFFLILGLLRLGKVSRKELGFEEEHLLLLPFALLISAWIYYSYFKGRPQMISSWMIVWFFVCLREYQHSARLKYAAGMIALSLAIANFHAGVWLVIAVFTGMALLESWIAKLLDLRKVAVFASVWLIGLLNPGGWKALLYILTVTKNDYNLLINEWKPLRFNSLENLPMMLLLLFFACTLPYALQRKPFRFFFMLGILYLGVSNYKQNLFMWLFIPYFAAALFEAIPLKTARLHFLSLSQSALRWLLAAGLLLNTAYIFAVPPEISTRDYPVKEMDYIMQHTPAGTRPKVLARYGSSGYVMFRGADILCDGRQDPFITKASVGTLGWNAFERSMYGFSEYLPEIVNDDKPDYVIIGSEASGKLITEWNKTFGTPAFKGPYGSVYPFRINSKKRATRAASPDCSLSFSLGLSSCGLAPSPGYTRPEVPMRSAK